MKSFAVCSLLIAALTVQSADARHGGNVGRVGRGAVLKKCKDFLHQVGASAVDPVNGMPQLKTLTDADTFRVYQGPYATLGTPVEGVDWTQYEALYTRLVTADPFVSFSVSFSKEIFERHNGGYTCVLHTHSNGQVASGKPYGQEYRMTLELNRDLKVTAFYEFVDSLYSACFFKLLPAAMCAAIGY
ncbi:hypothetical protein DIPPA_07661 [Diplonema papillatum]|nr:hypothetical protein DIPPA_07654 [Diplonema papillatum]KAJ9445699.1 hypothetical protein DIPPA_07658 [Diplonema papillatum]KAJ9445700.1 hypothetical protein DIPPA_07659 [Diplonema papillatum]KAJ9445701.1 hypothetical protein DIPPA_07662 [Diplonema papillatum]KAJ9445704.1 hypothetical protein DIPPA_07653 [Diplonema papillatum]